MRHRFSENWLATVLCMFVLLAAVPVVLSTATLGNASNAWAATGDDELEPAKSIETTGSEKAGSEKTGSEKAGSEKAGSEKAGSEKAGSEKAGSEKTGSEKTGSEKAVTEKAVTEKAVTEKDVTEKAVTEKAGSEKDGSEKDAADKTEKGDKPEKVAKPVVDKGDEIENVVAEKNVVGKAGADEAPSKESFLVWLYKSLGLRYVIIFLIITFNAVALIVMIVLGLRRNVICPDELAIAFEAKLNEKQYQEAYELAKADRSFLGKVLAAGMSKLSDGFDASQAAMQEVGEEQNMKLEQRNGYIALIAQIGPMFGLLGTVDGMVMAFDVISHSNVTPKPSELAQGIGTALVTTVVGLWIAIPMIAFYHIIRNRLSRLILEAGTVSGNLMKRFATVQVPPKKG